MDLDDTAAHPEMLAIAAERLGKIDLALIAHGVLGDQQAAEADFEIAAAILHTNFISTVSLLTWLGNYFQAQRGGTLAVVSSVAGDRGRKSNYVYGASKGGAQHLSGRIAQPDRPRWGAGADHQTRLRSHANDRACAAQRAFCLAGPGRPSAY